MSDDNFYSVQRLVEFGMGVAIARQMSESMQEALRQTHIPGSHTAPLSALARLYHVLLDGKPAGPFSERELLQLIVAGKLTKQSHVWKPGMAQWQLAEQVADVLRLVALAPPPFPSEGA
ncbi:DUF4339 domain-containing protein [Duganella sp. FT80W]|uniref:DUF4339 domain-containing protein n=1 Tax=Duganella guangzhouensis TaxID=2666084 RepID=A0A6I2L187_9BURK|nr:DUF4339 domain-containing protein [Duganella guangzhouensis]MRW91490.1 DUF4339 domain-containing protein [Duganella guangzhouensis]